MSATFNNGSSGADWQRMEEMKEANRRRLVAPEKLQDYHLGTIPAKLFRFLRNDHEAFSSEDAGCEFSHVFLKGYTVAGSLYVNDNYHAPRLGFEPREVVLFTRAHAYAFSYDEFAKFMTMNKFVDLRDQRLADWVLAN